MSHLKPVVRHESQVAVTEWNDDLRGRLRFRTLFGDGSGDTTAISAGVAYLEAGEWLGRHRHAATEMYFVLDGAGVMALEGVDHVVRAGHAIFVPGGTEHGIRNDAAGRLRFFYAFDVDAFDDVTYRYPGVDY